LSHAFIESRREDPRQWSEGRRGNGMDINEVFVLGAGFMGAGIGQVASLAGYRVTLADTREDRLEEGMHSIGDSLQRMVRSGKVEEPDADKALSEIKTTTDIHAAQTADIAVEAVPEDAELKRKIFAELDDICLPHAILATNTSAIPVSLIAAATTRPENVVATHFFGPVPVMRLCELAGGLLTSEDTVAKAEAWARSLGKETIRVRGDIAGFIANRVTIPSSLEAVRMVDEGVATAVEIDQALAAVGVKVGPMRIMDNAGIDVTFSAAKAIFDDTGDEMFFPPPLMRRMVSAGLLGRKSGRGFYDYYSGEPVAWDTTTPPRFLDSMREPEPGEARAQALFNRFYLPTIIESVRMLEAGRASPDDIDTAVRLGFNFPLGPLQTADLMGIDKVLEVACALEKETASRRFGPPTMLKTMVTSGRLGRICGKGFYDYPES